MKFHMSGASGKKNGQPDRERNFYNLDSDECSEFRDDDPPVLNS
jgi:hypothetical protein